VIVCNSFSKTWVMTGWRLGWLVVPDGTRDAITELVEVIPVGRTVDSNVNRRDAAGCDSPSLLGKGGWG
jgi:aspartate/methionine/tyrosine aminotransferase